TDRGRVACLHPRRQQQSPHNRQVAVLEWRFVTEATLSPATGDRCTPILTAHDRHRLASARAGRLSRRRTVLFSTTGTVTGTRVSQVLSQASVRPSGVPASVSSF